ncbi:hypothetical protein B7463_g6256, partial [Scytalidium lignicola]
MPPKRMTANPVRVPRYRPGKPLAEEVSSESEESDEETETTSKPIAPPPKATSAAGISSNLAKVDLNERRKAAVAQEAARLEAENALRAKEEEGQGKKAAANELVEEQIRKDLAAKAIGKKNWDDEDDDVDDVDDTDDIDPEAEYAAWKLRELKRIKRERETIEEREMEREEIERRKNLTEEERKAEDEAFVAKQKEEREGKGKMAYLQKYYHRGAFFQDDLKAEGLDKRDIMGSRYADDVQNRELLPQALQIRDMTKLGKKGATKYKDLKSEDTGRWGQFDDRRPRGSMGSFNSDDRFRPDRDRGGASGANTMPINERKRVPGAPEGPKAMREGDERPQGYRDTYRPSEDRDKRPRSRSRSPRWDRYQDDRTYRKRASSRDYDRNDGDKRQRMDSR